MRILITGGAGFIGSHLTDELKKKGHEIIVYDIRNNDDILDLENLKEKAKGIDGIVHFAALQRVISGFRKSHETIKINITGLNNVLEVCMENKAFIIFGSSKTVFGKPEKIPVKESDKKNPSNIYSLTKLMGEQIIKDFCKNYGLRGAVVRFSTIFGSERDLLDRVIPTFTYKALKNIDIKIEDKDRVVDPTFIDDIVPCLANLVEILKTKEGGFYDEFNFASGEGITLEQLAKKIIELTNSNSKIIGYAPPRTYDYGDFIGDPSKIIAGLGFKKTKVKDALKIYIERMRKAIANNRYTDEEIRDMLDYYNKR